MLSARTSSWLVCSAHPRFPGTVAQCTHQFLTRMLSVRISSLCACWRYIKWIYKKYENCAQGTDAYGQGAHQFLTRTLNVRIMLSMHIKMVHARKEFNIFDNLSTEKILNIANKWSQKLSDIFFSLKLKKFLLKGIVPQDFRLLVFFMNQFPTSPWVNH